MPKVKYQTRLPPDTAEEVEEYKDERGLTQAQTVRRLVQNGLEAEKRGSEERSVWETVPQQALYVVRVSLTLALAALATVLVAGIPAG